MTATLLTGTTGQMRVNRSTHETTADAIAAAVRADDGPNGYAIVRADGQTVWTRETGTVATITTPR